MTLGQGISDVDIGLDSLERLERYPLFLRLP